MDEHELRAHIESSFGPGPTQARGLAFHLTAYCWPGGSHDRGERSLGAPQPWTSELLELALASCSCASGRCIVCN